MLFVGVLLFSGWQRVELLQHGYRVEQMQKERGDEEAINRHLRLEIETLKSPQRIESLAIERPPSGGAGNGRGHHHRARRAGGAAGCVGRRPSPGDDRRERADSGQLARHDSQPALRRRRDLACCGPPASRRGCCICRCTSTRTFRRARRTSPRARWTSPPSAATSSIGTGACWPTASTATRCTACPARSKTRRKAASTLLCGALADCSAKEQEALAGRLRQKRAFVYVRRRVTPPQAQRIAELELDGIGFIKEDRRFYPKKQLAAQLLGFVGVDNKGLAGIEAAYDSQISGAQGKLLYQTDARGRAFSRLERPPTAGATVELTIDEYLQHVAERELRDAVARNRAAGGTVIDHGRRRPARFWRSPTSRRSTRTRSRARSPEQRRNRAVQDIYEPGSTFKVVTASAALEEHVIGVDDIDRRVRRTNPVRIARDRRHARLRRRCRSPT